MINQKHYVRLKTHKLSPKMNTTRTFPFGQPIIPVRQPGDERNKKVFILGVYASAVHVKWFGPDGKIRIKAMAVASEPEIFWNGSKEYVESVIRKIDLDPRYGHLEPADPAFNGPSGRCLDENYLNPLKLTRNEVWLCDLLPESRKNPSQKAALAQKYDNYVNIPYNFPSVPKIITDENRVNEIIEELEKSGTSRIILLGDEPIKYFLRHFDPSIKNLSAIKPYGKELTVSINNKKYRIVCLAHPRQTARLGNSSLNWYNCHQKWIKQKLQK